MLFYSHRNIIEFFKSRGIDATICSNYLNNLLVGINFCGWHFSLTKKFFLLVKISEDNIRLYKRRLKFILKTRTGGNFYTTLFLINKEILYWINIYGYADNFLFVSKDIDVYLHKLLWKFVKRLHSRKSNNWIYSRYWRLIGNSWRFFLCNSFSGQFLFVQTHTFLKHDFYTLPLSLKIFVSSNQNKLNFIWFNLFSKKLEGVFYVLWIRQHGICFSCGRLIELIDFDSICISHFRFVGRLNSFKTIFPIVLLHKVCS